MPLEHCIKLHFSNFDIRKVCRFQHNKMYPLLTSFLDFDAGQLTCMQLFYAYLKRYSDSLKPNQPTQSLQLMKSFYQSIHFLQ
jgi:hypothetical protein